jgi:hypothetical protein
MLENQEPQENQEPTVLSVDEQLQQIVIFPHNLREVSDIAVKPILDILGLEVKGGNYYTEPTAEQVTIRQELVKLNKLVRETEESLTNRRDEVRKLEGKVSELEDYLDENWDDIDEDLREKLCEIFRIDQEVTKTVNITITGSLEITAPRGYDWDNIENDLDIDGSVSITNSDLDESGYGFSVDDTEVEVD